MNIYTYIKVFVEYIYVYLILDSNFAKLK